MSYEDFLYPDRVKHTADAEPEKQAQVFDSYEAWLHQSSPRPSFDSCKGFTPEEEAEIERRVAEKEGRVTADSADNKIFTMDMAVPSSDGSVTFTNSIVARAGVLQYSHAEISGNPTADPFSKVGVYRPKASLFADSHFNSFEGAPVTVNHHQNVRGGSVKTVGYVTNPRKDRDYIRADIVISDKEALELCKHGMELSPGYGSVLDEQSGEFQDEHGMFDAEPYEFVQHPGYVDHVALVHRGRNGLARLEF